MEQLNILKEDIRSQKNEYNNLLNFEGRIKDFDNFKKLFCLSIENYKPKNKDQEESLKKIKEHLGLGDFDKNKNNKKSDDDKIDNLLTDNSEKKKSGIMGFFGSKKK
jgi:hypothetical protein